MLLSFFTKYFALVHLIAFARAARVEQHHSLRCCLQQWRSYFSLMPWPGASQPRLSREGWWRGHDAAAIRYFLNFYFIYIYICISIDLTNDSITRKKIFGDATRCGDWLIGCNLCGGFAIVEDFRFQQSRCVFERNSIGPRHYPKYVFIKSVLINKPPLFGALNRGEAGRYYLIIDAYFIIIESHTFSS